MRTPFQKTFCQFLDALASLDFKLSLSGSVSEGCFSASASSGLLELFLLLFLGFFDLQFMEDIKDGKEEVLDKVVMEHIK